MAVSNESGRRKMMELNESFKRKMTEYNTAEKKKRTEPNNWESSKMGASNKGPTPQDNLVWRRLATPRETMFGLRSNGKVRNICSHIEINSAMKINRDILDKCAEHFNRDIGCFHEFLVEKKRSNDIWLIKMNKNNYKIEELDDEDDIDRLIINDEINFLQRAENSPSWKLFCNYCGFDSSGGSVPIRYPFIYQLIFVFSTGTLDEFSCALICDLFLNILDCALKEHPFQCYSQLNMYDIGSKLEGRISRTIERLSISDEYYKWTSKPYHNMCKSNCSNFDFKRKKFIGTDLPFMSIGYTFDRECTRDFLELCESKNVGVYAVFIVILNNALMRHAEKNGFKGTFTARILHMINARYILFRQDKKYLYNLGSHFIPYMQKFKLKTTDIKEIFKEARRVESDLEGATVTYRFWDQEAIREISIKESGTKYNSGNWNPHYCFSVTNLGNLDIFYTAESPKNSFRVLSYERASTPIEGGHFDVVFFNFKNKLTINIDYSKEYFSKDEMIFIVKSIVKVLETIT